MAAAQDLSKLIPSDAKIEKLASGLQFVEGPAWMRDGFLIFSDIPANKMMKWSAKDGLGVFRDPSHNSNGNTLDAQGRLFTCETGTRRVSFTERDGTVKTLVDRYQEKKFNSPNDIVVKSDGTVWFTDPNYNIPKGEAQEQEHLLVYRVEPQTKNISPVAGWDFDKPNGLCFSPDEKKLYIADSGKPHHIRVFNVQSDGKLSGGDVFCVIDRGVPDGFRCDEFGNLWSSAGDGVQIFSPDGKLIGKIPVSETPANLCFGGDDGKTLYITARHSIYRIQTNVHAAKAT
ncbi:MAG TPA: SMP-30/gluconolactonase/LRE family protein [Tepidisphaeraceae bacterium]|nr:SMP-30/gluconolactonase/LRE family protein [Tepidisphaeraceae bacterium]